jgi:RIO kinase 2
LSLHELFSELEGVTKSERLLLEAFVRALKGREALSPEELAGLSGISRGRVDELLARLHRRGLIAKRGPGYALLSRGLDALSLLLLKQDGIISSLGRALGMGKEADVYEAVGGKGEELSLKLYRIGRVSFRDVRRKRAYVAPGEEHRWHLINMRAAAKEFRNASRAHRLGLRVPRPVAVRLHALVAERIRGMLLAQVAQLKDPWDALRQLLEQVRRAFKGGLVNSDLSAFNVLYDEGGRCWLIDWPQAVSSSHPNALALLRRDVGNILEFFRRRFGLRVELDEALRYVLEDRPEPAV